MNRSPQMELTPLEDGITHIRGFDMQVGVMYVITHEPTGHFYVGSSSNFANRKGQHLWSLKSGSHHNKRLQELYDKNPQLTFDTTPCESRERAYDLEQAAITANKDNPLLLNFCIDVRSPMKGLKFSDDHRLKISETNKGRVLDGEWRAKLAAAKMGKTQSEETRLKKSLATKGRPLAETHRLAAAEASRLACGKPVSIQGVVYPTLISASMAIGMEKRSVVRRLVSEDPKYQDWFYVEKELTVIEPPRVYHPSTDSIDHINVYSKGKTLLGRMLTNPSDVGFKHPLFGHFRTAEGLHFFLKTGMVDREYSVLSGFEARKKGKADHKRYQHNPRFDELMRMGWICKIAQNPELYTLVHHNKLPLTHYYFYGKEDNCKVIADTSGFADKLAKVCDFIAGRE